VFKLAVVDAIKHTDNDLKRKASAAAKLQRKKARYSTASVDNSLECRIPGKWKWPYIILPLCTFTTRHNDGVEAVDVATGDHLKEIMIRCYRSEVSNKAQSIELATRVHSYDDDASVVWLTERRQRITSSNARSIAKWRLATPVNHLVHQLLYSTFQGNSATRWGLQQEEYSVGVYTSWLHERGSLSPTFNSNCGLMVCTAHPWLAATPDGWVTDPEAVTSEGLVEFKNPYSYKDLAVSNAININKCDCLVITNGRVQLHSYYCQVNILHEQTMVWLLSPYHSRLSLWKGDVQWSFLPRHPSYFEALLHNCDPAGAISEGQIHSRAKGLDRWWDIFCSGDGTDPLKNISIQFCNNNETLFLC